VLIDGPIAGDVIVNAGRIELGPHARIAGRLRYGSRYEVDRDQAAEVTGGIERMEMRAGWPQFDEAHRHSSHISGWLFTLGLLLLAAVLVAVLPGLTAAVGDRLRARPWFSLLIGFVALVCIPAAAVVLLITVIGIPLALLAIAGYFVLLLLGYVVCGVALGHWLLARLRAAAAGSSIWRIGAAVLGVLIVALLARIPFVGGLVVLAALLLGLGALILTAVDRRSAPA